MTSIEPSVGHLEEEALKRKERLKRLKNLSNNENTENDNSNGNDKQLVLPKPLFRSYIPSDEKLKEQTLPKAVPESVEQQISDRLTEAKQKPIIDEVDLTSLAPRKVDWDLKRNLQKKLDKLEKRTQRAIAELIRERLKEASNNDLVAATQDLESTKEADDSDGE